MIITNTDELNTVTDKDTNDDSNVGDDATISATKDNNNDKTTVIMVAASALLVMIKIISKPIMIITKTTQI